MRQSKGMLIAALIVGLLATSGAAYAWWGGGPVWGWDGVPSMDETARPPEEIQKALDATAPLRREIHEKWFDYREALRKGDQKQADALSNELHKLRAELADKLGVAADMGPGHGPMGHPPLQMGPGATECPKHAMAQDGCPKQRHDGCNAPRSGNCDAPRYDGNCGTPHYNCGCDAPRYDGNYGNYGNCGGPRSGNCSGGCRQ